MKKYICEKLRNTRLIWIGLELLKNTRQLSSVALSASSDRFAGTEWSDTSTYQHRTHSKKICSLQSSSVETHHIIPKPNLNSKTIRTFKFYQIWETEKAQPELHNVTSLFSDGNNESLLALLSSYTAAVDSARRAGRPADEAQMWRSGHVLIPASPACQIMVALDSVHTAHGAPWLTHPHFQ